MQTLSFALDRFTKPLFKEHGMVQARLMTDWPIIVGHVLATYSTPVRIYFPGKEQKQGGTLTVEVTHAGFATELELQKEILLEKIATYFGYKAISRLSILHKPQRLAEYKKRAATPKKKSPPPALSPENEAALSAAVAHIADNALATALTRLGNYALHS